MREVKPLLWCEGYYAAGDEIMNFINQLDSGDMSGREVRSAIYGKCLEMSPGGAVMRKAEDIANEFGAAGKTLFEAIESARREAWNEAVAQAAKIAEPPLMHRVGKPGLWRRRRAQMAKDIRSLHREG